MYGFVFLDVHDPSDFNAELPSEIFAPRSRGEPFAILSRRY